MFQTFHDTASPDQGPERIALLRRLMTDESLEAVLVPRTDVHQGEYIAPCDERLSWLTGFTGSAGMAAILPDRAALFADGRYRVQGRAQCDEMIEIVAWPETSVADWLTAALPSGGKLGYDPYLHTVDEISGLDAALTPKGITLVEIENPIDRLRTDRPSPPDAPFFEQPETLTGESSTAKRTRLAESLRTEGARSALLTQPDSIAWLLNIRGADLAHDPVPQAFALLHDDGSCDLFARPGKTNALTLPPEIRVHPDDQLEEILRKAGGPVRIDPASAPKAIATVLGDRAQHGKDPCLLPKALKSKVEIAGARAAHQRDGVAMVRFLHWLQETAPGDLTEIDVTRKLEGFRQDTGALREISFDTICGSGPHGAIIHYRVTETTNRALQANELLLVDSGAQYQDGTTDITRTMVVGDPTDEMRDTYTRVLKGVIAVTDARFPKGTTGAALDPLARRALWAVGRDYPHGTGHGVGSYLSVHEGPQSISSKGSIPLEPGMILSNEPGYYREGAFGIRLENLIVVTEAPPLPGQDDRLWLGFETLTYVPFERRLIDKSLLSDHERSWLDHYHQHCFDLLHADLDAPSANWLRQVCAPL